MRDQSHSWGFSMPASNGGMRHDRTGLLHLLLKSPLNLLILSAIWSSLTLAQAGSDSKRLRGT